MTRDEAIEELVAQGWTRQEAKAWTFGWQAMASPAKTNAWLADRRGALDKIEALAGFGVLHGDKS